MKARIRKMVTVVEETRSEMGRESSRRHGARLQSR